MPFHMPGRLISDNDCVYSHRTTITRKAEQNGDPTNLLKWQGQLLNIDVKFHMCLKLYWYLLMKQLEQMLGDMKNLKDHEFMCSTEQLTNAEILALQSHVHQ